MQKKLWDILREEDCTRCDLYEDAQSPCLIGDGPYPCDIMLIGEAPGFREDDIRKPFAGRSGKLLDQILHSIKWDRERIYITNVVHCRPRENKKPSIKQIRACRYFLYKEIEYVKPKKIILMGRVAAIGLLDERDLTIEQMRGREFSYNESKVFVTYHPAAASRRPFLTQVIRKDLNNYLNGVTKDNTPVDYRTLTDRDFEILKTDVIGVDLETDGLDVMRNSIKVFGITPKARMALNTSNPHKFKEKIGEIMDNPEILKEGHNIKFDLKFLLKEGYIRENLLPKNKFFCTRIAFNILDENYLQKDLEHLAVMFTSMEKWKNDDEDFKDIQSMKKRNLKDVDAHKRLYNVFSKRLKKEGLEIPFKIDMDMLKVLVSAEFHGVKVDTKELNDLTIKLEKEIEKLADKIKVNPSSNKQLTKYFREYGIRSPVKTDAGAPSWGKDVLENLSEELEGRRKEIIDRILRYKKLFGIKTKFLDSMPGFLDIEDKVHPTFNQAKAYDNSGDEEGTVTGRLSCKNPNLLFIPRERETLEYEINPRRLFIPSRKDGFILSWDYNQIEVRVAAELGDDEDLINLFLQGGDVHRLIAAEVFGKPPDKISNDERKEIKKVVFGILYMISDWGLSKKINKSKETAGRHIRNFFKKFPKQEERIDNARDVIIREQEIQNLFGRKRRLPGATTLTPEGNGLIRQGVNFPIQSSAADIAKIAMYKIYSEMMEKGLQSHIFANVYDAGDVDGAPGEKDELIDIIIRHTEKPKLKEYGIEKLKCPLKIEIKTGKNWLDMKGV